MKYTNKMPVMPNYFDEDDIIDVGAEWIVRCVKPNGQIELNTFRDFEELDFLCTFDIFNMAFEAKSDD